MSQDQKVADLLKPYTFETHYAALNDSIKIAYVEEGTGDKTLLFIHGLATYLPSWQKNIEVLKKDYRCIAIDLPGYGRSSKDYISGSMGYYADIIHEFIEHKKLKNVILVGHSMGAQVSMTTALKYNNIEALILAAPAGIETFSETESQWMKSIFKPESIAAATPNQIEFNYGLNFFKMPDDLRFMITDRINMTKGTDFSAYCKAVSLGVFGMLDEPVYNRLSELNIPTLVVYGKNDALIPNKILHKTATTQQVADDAHAQIKNSELVMIDECGHFVPFEKADIFNQKIFEFLSSK
ncbi:alpha/beta hydrolase [Fulvivirga lutimaris]|nr:alpha/beta hydrolase [Fulvivirga lutimaris]